MTETNAGRQPDLLDLIGQDVRNSGVEHGDLTLTIIRGVLTSRGMVVPTLDDVTPIVTQTAGGIAEIVTAHQAPAYTDSERRLELAIAQYKDHKESATGLAELYKAHWDHYRIPMGLDPSDVTVTDCPYTDEEIRQFMKLDDPKEGNPDADLGLYLPAVLASEDGRFLIGKGFPKMGSWAFQPGHNIKNGHAISGWMRVEASLDAPFRTNNKGKLTGLSVDELNKAIKAVDERRVGQIVNVYAASGPVINSLFKYYPDSGSTWSRLPESLKDGRVLDAYFYSDGYLLVGSDWSRGSRDPCMGGRSLLGV